MLTLHQSRPVIHCQRREFLRIGSGLAMTGLVLPGNAWLSTAQANPGVLAAASGRAKSCILVYLLGGPPHQDMFDLKPYAPAEVRGPFLPISTNVPGTQVCEHLPKIASIADKYALIRSVSHRNSNHTPMIYYTLTGFHTAQPGRDNDIRPPQRDDFPHLGSVIAQRLPSPEALPGYVAIPEVAIRTSIKGQYKRAPLPLRGGNAGFLGPGYAPLAVNGPPGTPEAVPAVTLPEEVSLERFDQRAELLATLDQSGPKTPSTGQLAVLRERAITLTGAANRGTLDAFSIDDEPEALRERYGNHRFGRSMLLARRLAGLGVPMVSVHFNNMTICDGWDLHSKNFEALQSELLPMVDQTLSALLEDLDARGKLDETLVVCMGEFGRTPKINKNAGRDHWGECSTTLLAGGGIHGGAVLGTSDKNAAYPESDPVDPVDVQATIYHCLGLDANQKMTDLAQRIWPITNGEVIRELV